MKRPGRRLSADEAAAWARVADTVAPLQKPLAKPSLLAPIPTSPAPSFAEAIAAPSEPVLLKATQRAVQPNRPARPIDRHGLDAGWERRIARGTVAPDFTLDLHGASLDAAYSRLLHGLAQAQAMGARVVLVITGKPRPVDAADRGQRRGAIRAKIVDWLAASSHAGDIAAIRSAHRRHGGEGALYIVLKRRR